LNWFGKTAMLILVILLICSSSQADMYEGKDCPPDEIVRKNVTPTPKIVGKTVGADGKYTPLSVWFYSGLIPGYGSLRTETDYLSR
jgi:hypothetical protein